MNWIKSLLSTILVILTPIKLILAITEFLIIIDLLTGILAAKKRGEQIKSAPMRRTITKLFVYNLAIIVGFLVEKYMLSDTIPVSKLVSGVIGLVEGTSILENLNTINGNNIFKDIIIKLGSKNDEQKKD